MLILGLTGGLDLPYQQRDFLFPSGWFHDSAAVLVKDAKIVAAVEEERLNRIKHTNKAAVSAIKFCLDSGRIRLRDLDQLVVAANENFLNHVLKKRDLMRIAAEPLPTPREMIHEMLNLGFGDDIDDSKLIFLPHHLAHAVSAHALSGFDRSLVFTADGGGDDIAGMILNAEGSSLKVLQQTSMQKSLGIFYLSVIGFLGFGLFEEYKVMGLAPYGDPKKYRALFKTFYDLLPDGEYAIKLNLPDGLADVGKPRKKQDPLTQFHKDIAASLQESLEAIVLHVLRHYQSHTGQKNLCLAGGVAHNCTVNGKLMYSGMFENIFVQPAAHDGGLALGAALYPYLKDGGDQPSRISQLEHVYLGPDIGDRETVSAALNRWSDYIDFQPDAGIAERAAKLIAQGAVIGWVQGRSEFGPRALGNRSIVADPRPAENKNLINKMVKKREAYRPFAPAVLVEYADEYFQLPPNAKQFPFMTFVVKVREDRQQVMQATTHVDGTARIQTVDKLTNRKFWELIDAFRKITGVPVLLNTSFNNNVEPIVDSINDAVVSFLTTKLNYLVVGDFLVSKKAPDAIRVFNLVPELCLYTKLVRTEKFLASDQRITVFEITNTYNPLYHEIISSEAFHLLLKADGSRTLNELLAEENISDAGTLTALQEEMMQLWANRQIILSPR